MRRLTSSDDPDLKKLLSTSNLMIQDIDIDGHFYFGEFLDESLVATAALQIYGSNALIRSVAVDKNFKNNGLGKKIVLAVEQWATEHDIQQIYLLTETADGFFSKLRYRQTPKIAVPTDIAHTSQFAALCPETAICMKKKLSQKA